MTRPDSDKERAEFRSLIERLETSLGNKAYFGGEEISSTDQYLTEECQMCSRL